MNRYQLYRLLKQHIKMGERRNPMFERNRSAKYIIYGMVAFWALYLVVIGVEFFFVAKSSDDVTGYELIGGMMPFILSIDFLIRFMMTQTPCQMVKPYALLPLPKFSCLFLIFLYFDLYKYKAHQQSSKTLELVLLHQAVNVLLML